uniref:Store-operated calcium entry-associated regulatory factor n=1 Tax=Arcella intermedia TaxID=1963864 RepID=A0A6B2LDR9_9EUKA
MSFTLSWSSGDRILLSDVKTLTFVQYKLTEGRRSRGIPQLACVGGTAQHSNELPGVVQCTNVGTDGYDVQWECKADLSTKVKFGEVTVSCEGYDHPEDPYILRGSCGLEYALEYVSGASGGSSSTYYEYSPSGGSGIGSLVLFLFLVFIFYQIFKSCSGAAANGAVGGDGYGGPGFGPGYGGPGYGGGAPYGPGCPPPSGYSTGSGLGFGSGLLAGGLFSSMFNRRPYGGYGYGGYGYGGYGSGGYRSTHFGASSVGGGSRLASGFGRSSRR